MVQEIQLFKTPSIETHLIAITTDALDEALELRNAEGGYPTEPEVLHALVADLLERFTVTDVPRIDEGSLTYHNDRNQTLIIRIPISGHLQYLNFQVRSLPPPVFVGQIQIEPTSGAIAISYKLTKDWESALDGDLALLKTYVGAIGQAIQQFNQNLATLIGRKVESTLLQNQVRRDIASKLTQRGFFEA